MCTNNIQDKMKKIKNTEQWFGDLLKPNYCPSTALAPLLGNNSSSELSAPLWFHVIVVVRED